MLEVNFLELVKEQKSEYFKTTKVTGQFGLKIERVTGSLDPFPWL